MVLWDARRERRAGHGTIGTRDADDESYERLLRGTAGIRLLLCATKVCVSYRHVCLIFSIVILPGDKKRLEFVNFPGL